MSLITLSSPHLTRRLSTQHVMLIVIALTLPGLAVQTWFFGYGNLVNVIWCSLVALLSEAFMLKARRMALSTYLSDYSAVLTGVLLGLALPPFAPWWVSLVATSFAIIFAKNMYGGMGYNPFNPAMIGYALVLVSFPVAMTTNWATPLPISEGSAGLIDTLGIIFGQINLPDGFSGATPLDTFKNEIKVSSFDEVMAQPIYGSFVSLGWEWVNIAFAAGGVILIALKIIPWQTPAGVLAGLMVPATVFSVFGENQAPASLHLFSGATMLGAFFIATDPVSSPTTTLGRLLYGIGIGALTYAIRSFGGYPDAIAFSVLLMNLSAPLIDLYTQPRAYGYRHAVRGPKAKR